MLCERHLDLAQQLECQVLGLLLVDVLVEPDGFYELVADGVDGAEGGHGLLEDVAYLGAAYRAHLPAAGLQGGQVDHLVGALAVEYLAVHYASWPAEGHHDGEGGDALAAAALADDAEGLPLVQVEADPVHGDHVPLVQGEVGREVPHRQQGLPRDGSGPATGRMGLLHL